jgi:heme-degrading monooxygenase HmoA
MLDLVRRSGAVSDQLATTPGLIGFTFRAKLLRHRFWTLSVWENEQALIAFVGKSPHLDAMTVLQPHMGKTAFVRWTVKGNELPLRWDDALTRMPSTRP